MEKEHETVADHSTQQRVGSVQLHTTSDVARVEAPVTWKAYLICAFASFGGIFFGYDSGYINGVLGSAIFIREVEGAGRDPDDGLTSSHQSLVVSILSAGTFFGAIIAGDVADIIGRKWTVIAGCVIYLIGVVIQMLTGPEVDSLGAIVAGRVIAGLGVGFESAIVILYMSEIVSSICILWQRCTRLTTNYSAPAKSVALWLLATNSASPSASCWHLLSSMLPRIATILAHTASRSPSSSHGV
jgi:MFS family permease